MHPIFALYGVKNDSANKIDENLHLNANSRLFEDWLLTFDHILFDKRKLDKKVNT